MDQDRDTTLNNRYGIFSMWLNWLYSAGALMVALLTFGFITPKLYPVVVLLLSLFNYLMVRRNRFSNHSVCAVTPFYMSKALFFSALVMIAINMLHRYHYIDLIVADTRLVNPDIPFIPVMILFPMTALMMFIVGTYGKKIAFCRDCLRTHGEAGERGFLGDFYSKEGVFQSRFMFRITLIGSLIAYIYYFFFYINVNINAPDYFFFVIAPELVLFFSIIYVAIRYVGVWNYFKLNFGSDSSLVGRTTNVRFLIIHDDRVLVNVPELLPDTEVEDLRAESPVTLTVRRKEYVTLDMAENYFAHITNIDDFKIRFLYSTKTGNADFSVFHFLVTLPSDEIPADARLKGDWVPFAELNAMLNAQALTPMFSTEIIRLVRIVMAWKTYDANGNRRYKIKNYRPKFRLSDIDNDEINFDDSRWLYISDNNADKPFFRIRRFWSRNISGSFKSPGN